MLRRRAALSVPWLSFAWLCGHVVVSKKCGSYSIEFGREGKGSVPPLGVGASWGLCVAGAMQSCGAVVKAVDQHRCEFVQLHIGMSEFVLRLVFIFLKRLFIKILYCLWSFLIF